jgi:hypothetical protein
VSEVEVETPKLDLDEADREVLRRVARSDLPASEHARTLLREDDASD